MPLCFFPSMPAAYSCQLYSLPVPMGSQAKVLTHQKPLATQQLAARPAAQTSSAWAQAGIRRGQVAGAAPLGCETPAKTVRKPSSNPSCPLAPSCGSAGEPGLQRKKPTSQSRGVFQTLLLTASARTIRQPAGLGRKHRGRTGEGPNHPMQRREPHLSCWQPACWPPPPVPAERGTCAQKVNLALC